MPTLLPRNTIFYSNSKLKEHFDEFLSKTKQLKNKLEEGEDRTYLEKRVRLLEAINEKILTRFDHDCTKNKCTSENHSVNEFGFFDLTIFKDIAQLRKELFPDDIRTHTPHLSTKESLEHIIDSAEFINQLIAHLNQLQDVIQARIKPNSNITSLLKNAVLWFSTDAEKRAYGAAFKDYQEGEFEECSRAVIERVSGEALDALYRRHALVGEGNLPEFIRNICDGQYIIVRENGDAQALEQVSQIIEFLHRPSPESMRIVKIDPLFNRRVERQNVELVDVDNLSLSTPGSPIVVTRRIKKVRPKSVKLNPSEKIAYLQQRIDLIEQKIDELNMEISKVNDEISRVQDIVSGVEEAIFKRHLSANNHSDFPYTAAEQEFDINQKNVHLTELEVNCQKRILLINQREDKDLELRSKKATLESLFIVTSSLQQAVVNDQVSEAAVIAARTDDRIDDTLASSTPSVSVLNLRSSNSCPVRYRIEDTLISPTPSTPVPNLRSSNSSPVRNHTRNYNFKGYVRYDRSFTHMTNDERHVAAATYRTSSNTIMEQYRTIDADQTIERLTHPILPTAEIMLMGKDLKVALHPELLVLIQPFFEETINDGFMELLGLELFKYFGVFVQSDFEVPEDMLRLLIATRNINRNSYTPELKDFFNKIYWGVIHSYLEKIYLHNNHGHDAVTTILLKWETNDKFRGLAIGLNNLSQVLTDLDTYNEDTGVQIVINSLVDDLRVKMDVFILKLNFMLDPVEQAQLFNEFQNDFLSRLDQDKPFLFLNKNRNMAEKIANIALIVLSVLTMGMAALGRLAYSYSSTRRVDFWIKSDSSKQLHLIEDTVLGITKLQDPVNQEPSSLPTLASDYSARGIG